MPREHPGRSRLDRLAVGHVADLDLAADLLRDRAQLVLPPRDEHAAPATRGEQPGGRLADPRRAPVTTATRAVGGSGSGAGVSLMRGAP